MLTGSLSEVDVVNVGGIEAAAPDEDTAELLFPNWGVIQLLDTGFKADNTEGTAAEELVEVDTDDVTDSPADKFGTALLLLADVEATAKLPS